MKKILLSSFIFLLTLTMFSQTAYEKGYYLDNNGNKNEGYFKLINFDEINDKSFTSLNFKKELADEEIKLPIENITEFAIAQDIKYQKMNVQMDDVDLRANFNQSKELDLKPTTGFLNVLVEGKANLYAFQSGNGTKYFYKINDKDSEATQLQYKKYLNTEGTAVENAYFREQMFNNVKCEDQTFNDFLNIKYEKKQLISFFEKFNKCQNSPSVVYENKKHKHIKLLVTAFAGANYVNFNMADIDPETSSSSNVMPNIGGELEVLFPSEKWAVFVSGEYSYLKTSVSGTRPLVWFNPVVTDTYDLDSSFLDVALGMRWYKSLSNGGKLFLGAAFAANAPSGGIEKTRHIQLSDPVYLITENSHFDLDRNVYFKFEVGYKFTKHIGMNLIADTNKNLFESNKHVETKLFRTGLNFRYTF